MPKRSKNGPPYTDLPDEVYVVVTDPWGMQSRNPRERVQRDFNRVAAWARFALQQAGLGGGNVPMVECIYSMGTRSEIILQFPAETNVVPLLGEHRWANFANHCPDPNRSTRVFIYNWRNNGDPANHNWSENFPEPISLKDVPAKSPYPPPSWTSPPSTLTNLVQAIPRPAIPPPNPDNAHNLGREQQTASSPSLVVTPSPTRPQRVDNSKFGELPERPESASTSHFKPYEPPPQHPSHAPFPNRSQTQPEEPPPPQTLPPSFKLIKKLDPYELEEDALNLIRSSNPKQEETDEEDIKPTLRPSVKLEIKEEDGELNNIASTFVSEYQPSQALVDAFNSLHQPEHSSLSSYPLAHEPGGLDAGSQILAPASRGYQPSAELEAEINALLQGGTATASSPSSSNARPTPGAGTHVCIKREYEDDIAILLGERKKIKIEDD